MPLTDERADIDFQILREDESKKIARGRERRGKGKEGGRERPSGGRRSLLTRFAKSKNWSVPRGGMGRPMDTEKHVYHEWQQQKTSRSSRSGFLPELKCSSGVS